MSDKFPEKAGSLTKTRNDLRGEWRVPSTNNASPWGHRRDWRDLIAAMKERRAIRISPFLNLEFRLGAAHLSNPRQSSDRHETLYILEGDIDSWVAEAEKVIGE